MKLCGVSMSVSVNEHDEHDQHDQHDEHDQHECVSVRVCEKAALKISVFRWVLDHYRLVIF